MNYEIFVQIGNYSRCFKPIARSAGKKLLTVVRTNCVDSLSLGLGVYFAFFNAQFVLHVPLQRPSCAVAKTLYIVSLFMNT